MVRPREMGGGGTFDPSMSLFLNVPGAVAGGSVKFDIPLPLVLLRTTYHIVQVRVCLAS